MSITITSARRAAGIAAFTLLAAGGTAFAAAPASAAPDVCQATPGQSAGRADCQATSSATGTSAAIGDTTGAASADAGRNGLSLGIGLDGGTATSSATNYSAPAAIAVGPRSTATLTGIKPGLAIGIAGRGATVTLNGKDPATCSGGPSFAGDFQTFSGCIDLGNGPIPLGNR